MKVPWLKLPKGTPAFREYYVRKKVWPLKSQQRLEQVLAAAKQRRGR
jgi:hypothetical protein